jgi:hypothetical protein
VILIKELKSSGPPRHVKNSDTRLANEEATSRDFNRQARNRGDVMEVVPENATSGETPSR